MLDAIETAIASSSASVQTAFTDNLNVIFVIFGALVALGLLIRLFKKLVGRKAA